MWRSAFLHLSTNGLMRRLATGSGLARSIASRFAAGETIESAIRVARKLDQRGAAAELDCLGENVADARRAEAARDCYLDLLDQLRDAGLQGDVALKLTQMGLDVDEGLALASTAAIASRAEVLGSAVWLDMEGSSYTDRTLEIYSRLRADHPNLGVALQAYLYRTKADLRHVLSIGGMVRLCKGAYMESPSVAYARRADVDRNFATLTEMLLASRTFQAIATHDQRMIRHATEFARIQGIAKNGFEFQMLYGIRRDVQERLLADGYRLRVYVPFGTEWYPYFMRRLAERPANLLFLIGSLLRESQPGPRGTSLAPRLL